MSLITNDDQFDSAASNGVLLKRFIDTECDSSFSLLVERHVESVRSVSRGILTYRKDRVDDVVQETFIRLANQASRIAQPEQVRSWLCAVARNEALKILRSGKKEYSLLNSVARNGSSRRTVPVQQHDLLILWDEINMLPALVQKIIIARFIDGKSQRIVSESTGVPKGSIGHYETQGIRRLRARLLERGVAVSPFLLLLLLGLCPASCLGSVVPGQSEELPEAQILSDGNRRAKRRHLAALALIALVLCAVFPTLQNGRVVNEDESVATQPVEGEFALVVNKDPLPSGGCETGIPGATDDHPVGVFSLD